MELPSQLSSHHSGFLLSLRHSWNDGLVWRYCQSSPGDDHHGKRDDNGLHALNSQHADLLDSLFVTGASFIFESQVDVRAESPAHRHEYSNMLLKAIKVKEAMTLKVPTISSQSMMDEMANLLKEYEVHAVPVVDYGKLVGIVAKLDVVGCIYQDRPRASVNEIMSTKLVVTYPDESLFDAMNKMIVNRISQLPVVERDNPDQLLGLLSLDDVTRIQCTAFVS